MTARRGSLLAATAILLATASGCRSEDKNQERAVSRAKPDPPATLADLAREVSLTFPPSARLVGLHRESGMDDYLQFKVELDARQLPQFQASSPIPPEAMRPGAGGLLGPDHDFWDPHAAPSLRTGQKMLPGARALNIGVAEAGGGKAALYIVNHGT